MLCIKFFFLWFDVVSVNFKDNIDYGKKKLFYEGFEVMYFCNIEFLLFCDMLYYLVKNFGKKLNDILVMCNIVFVWL